MAKTNKRDIGRRRRKLHIRKRVRGTTERPRLCVFRSAKHIYAQIIDDTSGRTLAAASSLSAELSDSEGPMGNREAAAKVGGLIATRAIDAGVSQVCFDRNGYLFHGRVKALADAARGAGLKF
jgi:large subunit ribosomal protein L18